MNKKKVLKNVLTFALVGCLSVGTLAFTGCGKKKEETAKAPDNINPLTGLELKKGEKLPDRPIIVSTDNDSHWSRPQAGISQADILMEVPIEGGGSRYEPVYYSQISDLGLVGAIRSVRPYILDFAREYNAVFVHNGQSPQAKAYFQDSGVDRVSAAEYFKVFHAEAKNQDRLPGNLYSTGKDILSAMKELKYDQKKEVRTFPWLSDKDKVEGKDAITVEVNYADGAYNTFKYDSKTKTYKKFVKDIPLVDENNNKELSFSNILVQIVPFQTYGSSERLDIDMYKGGDALMFTQGKYVKGTWERKDKDSPTIFKDSDGKEFKMTPGTTAIQLVDSTVKLKY